MEKKEEITLGASSLIPMLTRENSEKIEDVAIPSENSLFRMLYHCTIGVLQKDG